MCSSNMGWRVWITSSWSWVAEWVTCRHGAAGGCGWAGQHCGLFHKARTSSQNTTSIWPAHRAVGQDEGAAAAPVVAGKGAVQGGAGARHDPDAASGAAGSTGTNRLGRRHDAGCLHRRCLHDAAGGRGCFSGPNIPRRDEALKSSVTPPPPWLRLLMSNIAKQAKGPARGHASSGAELKRVTNFASWCLQWPAAQRHTCIGRAAGMEMRRTQSGNVK